MEVRFQRQCDHTRERIISTYEAEESKKLKAQKMKELAVAKQNAEKLLRDDIWTALKLFKGNEAEGLMVVLDSKVFCTRMDPFGKYRLAIRELSEAGIDVGSGFFQAIMNKTRQKIIEMTDPKKFY